MDRNHPILPRLGFGSALHRPGLKVYIFRLQVQKFADPPPGIKQDQNRVNPRFFLMFPNLLDFFLAEGKAGGWWDRIRSQQVRIATGDNVHFKGKPVKMAPKVLNCRLCTRTPSRNRQWFLAFGMTGFVYRAFPITLNNA